MKKYLICFAMSLVLFASAFAQNRKNPAKQLDKSPGNQAGYALISDNNGELVYQDLNLAGYNGAGSIVFAPNNQVTPTVTCSPSLQEIADWNNDGSPNLDAVIYYNCTNDANVPSTYVFYVGADTNVVLLESPAEPANFGRRTIPSPAFADPEAPREIEVRNYILNLAPPPKPGTLFVQGTGAIPMAQTNDNPATTWFYDGVRITRVKDFPRKKEIPDAAFADTLNPTVPEVYTWLGVDTTYQGNYWLLYNVGAGTIESPDWVWSVNGDYTTARTDIMLVKKPGGGPPTNGLQLYSGAIGLGGNLTQTTTNVNGSNESMRFIMSGTGNGGFWWTNRANLYVDQDHAYIGLPDGTIGLFDAVRSDTSANIMGKYAKFKGLGSGTGPVISRYFDTDYSHYMDLVVPGTISANFKLTWPSAKPTANGQNLIGNLDGTMSWATPSASGPSYASLNVGTMTATITYTGSSAPTLTNPSAGNYTITLPSGTTMTNADIFFSNSHVNGSNEYVLAINNTANSRARRVQGELYTANNGALVNPFATGTNWTQLVSSNTTTITIPGANGNGAAGFNFLIN